MAIAGYILAGGKNRRMNREQNGDVRKKLFLEYKGKRFLDYALEALADMEQIYLSVEAEDPYRELGLPLVTDQYPAIGPIGGIYSGLKECEEQALFILPSDTPHVTCEVTRKLYTCHERSGRPVVAVCQGRMHPLIGIYTKECLPAMEELIGNRQYRMMELLRQITHDTIEIEDEKIVQNINDQEDYCNLTGGSE